MRLTCAHCCSKTSWTLLSASMKCAANDNSLYLWVTWLHAYIQSLSLLFGDSAVIGWRWLTAAILNICLSVCVSACPSVSLYVCVSVYERFQWSLAGRTIRGSSSALGKICPPRPLCCLATAPSLPSIGQKISTIGTTCQTLRLLQFFLWSDCGYI